MKINQPLWVRLFALAVGEVLLLGGLWMGIRRESRAVNDKVNEISDLRDPSPFRAALLGHLGKIHLAIQGYLHNPDPTLEKQVDDSRADFEALLPDFVAQNPKLFPQAAAEEIRRTFGLFKESVARTMEANTHRLESRGILEQNFTQILYLIDHNLRPLIHKEQADGEERSEAILNIENQARAWHENLAKAWTEPTDVAKAIAYENDNRGQTYLDLYSRLELLPRERKVQRQIRTLWLADSDLARESHVKENLVSQADKAMEAERDEVISTLNRLLPAMPPTELEAKKETILRSIHFHMAGAFVIGLLGLASLVAAVLLGYRVLRAVAKPKTSPVADGLFRPSSPPAAAGQEPTLQMDLKGTITAWSPAAEALYGYSPAEMQGQSIGKLFESESEISRLGRELQEAKQAIFETIHKTKAGASMGMRIEFRPVADSAAIGLICTRR
jgi:PAS domain S-box-containing protein